MQTDGAGIPVGVVIDGANRHDKKLVAATIESIPVERPRPTRRKKQGMCMDKGYDFEDTREMLVQLEYTPHVRSRGAEQSERSQTPGYRARRCVVERTHSWLNRYRRLLIRWEKKAANYLAFTHLACAIIAFRGAGVPG